MQALPNSSPPRPLAVQRVKAFVTHGFPGAVIGAVVVVTFLANRMLNQLWEALPILLSFGLMLFAVVWLVFTIERKDRPGDEKRTAEVYAVIFFIIGAVVCTTAWRDAHSAQLAKASPPPTCNGHWDTRPQVIHVPSLSGITTIVTCGDGYTFQY
jgi:heme A synthase